MSAKIQDTLSSKKHKLFGIYEYKVVVSFMDKEIMKKIVTTMIRPKLKYASVVWLLHKKKEIRN